MVPDVSYFFKAHSRSYDELDAQWMLGKYSLPTTPVLLSDYMKIPSFFLNSPLKQAITTTTRTTIHSLLSASPQLKWPSVMKMKLRVLEHQILFVISEYSGLKTYWLLQK